VYFGEEKLNKQQIEALWPDLALKSMSSDVEMPNEQQLEKILFLDLFHWIKYGTDLPNELLTQYCNEIIVEAKVAAQRWDFDYSARLFIPTIQLLKNPNLNDSLYSRFAQTLYRVIWEFSYVTRQDSASAYKAGPGTPCGRIILASVLNLQRKEFEEVCIPTTKLVIFLEAARPSTLMASFKYMEQLPGICSFLEGRMKESVQVSIEDEEIARNFFKEIPRDIFKKLAIYINTRPHMPVVTPEGESRKFCKIQ
jgi:hypothetical protein